MRAIYNRLVIRIFGSDFMEKFDERYKYAVNVKNGKIHRVDKADKRCYGRMDQESVKYFDNLETAFSCTDAHIKSCGFCMIEDAPEWHNLHMKARENSNE